MKSTLPKLSLLVLLALAPAAHALTITEDFDYTAGLTLNGQNGGTGWGGAWAGSTGAVIASPSLDYPGSTESGNKAVLEYNGSTYTIFRALGATIDGTTATSASLSFLFNLTGNDADTGIRFAGLSLFSGTGDELIFFGKPGNTTEVGIEKYSGGNEVLGVDTSFSSSTVFKFQADFVLSALGTSTVTVNLFDNSGGGTLLASWEDLSLGTNFSFDHVRLIRDFALDDTINAEVDEVQMNTVPEPSTWALLGVALGAILLVRSRRMAVL